MPRDRCSGSTAKSSTHTRRLNRTDSSSSYAVHRPTNRSSSTAISTTAESEDTAWRSAAAARSGSQSGTGEPGGAKSHSYIGGIRSTSASSAALTIALATRSTSIRPGLPAG